MLLSGVLLSDAVVGVVVASGTPVTVMVPEYADKRTDKALVVAGFDVVSGSLALDAESMLLSLAMVLVVVGVACGVTGTITVTAVVEAPRPESCQHKHG